MRDIVDVAIAILRCVHLKIIFCLLIEFYALNDDIQQILHFPYSNIDFIHMHTHLCTFKFSSLKAHVVVAPKFQDFSWINMNNVYDSESRISTMKGNAAMDATSVFRFKSLLSLSASHAICAKIQTFTIFECVHRFIFIHHSCRLLTTNILYFHLSYKVRLFSLRLDCIVNNNNI